MPKQTWKAYIILEGYDKIVNAKDPNIQLFSIPISMQNVQCKKIDSKGYKQSLQLLESFYINKHSLLEFLFFQTNQVD